jgi:putative spermidine/putrescine transport system permease protein
MNAPSASISRAQATVAALLAAVCLVPFAYLAALSVADPWTFPALAPEGWSLARWGRMLTGAGALGPSLSLSLGLSLTVAIASTAAGYVTGKFIAYHPWRRRLLVLAYVPFVMAPVILGVCLMYLFLRMRLAGSVAGVMLAQTMFAYGFSIIFFNAFWSARLKAMEDLVATLGGTTAEAYRRVLLPVSVGMLLICFFQTFLISWFQYGLTLLVGAGKVQTLPLKVYDFVSEANMYYAALASCLLVLPPVALLWVNKRFVFRHGLGTT